LLSDALTLAGMKLLFARSTNKVPTAAANEVAEVADRLDAAIQGTADALRKLFKLCGAKANRTPDLFDADKTNPASVDVDHVGVVNNSRIKRSSPLRRPDQPFWGRQFIGGTKGAHTGWKYGGGSGPSQMFFPPSLIGTLPRPNGVSQYV
jgi:hypothetical protein